MRKTLSKLDKPLLIVTFIFFVFGLIMILSASSMESFMRHNYSPYHFFIRQLIFLGVGMVLFLFTIFFPTKNYKRFSLFLLIGIILALGLLFFFGHESNNALSWYKVGPFTIQPSEFAKIIIIIYLAVYYDKNKDSLDNQFSIIKPLLFVMIAVLLVVIEPDMGTAFVIGLITIMMFYAVPIDKKYRHTINKIFIGGIFLVAAIVIATGGKFLQDYQLKRFNFLDPCERYQEKTGYQLCNSFIAFTNGKVTGQGLGKSTQKYLYLPESYTDFIFPIIVEEWGLIVGVIIIILYMFVLLRIINNARRATSLQNSLICYGIFAYFLFHIMINLMGVMGMIPLTGVPLPFLSYGGSYTMCTMAALGLVQRVAVETNYKKEKDS